ncbi:MAG: hypothetical protein JXB39_16315 [Deltaproteobacteria bacterium]|nr:hypothetical protein [Deltaproteobacteria bacterium]
MPALRWSLVAGLLPVLGCGPKTPVVVIPEIGWHSEEGWKGACYYPPEWEGLEDTERRIARQAALEEMKRQWRGLRQDGVQFDAEAVEDVETTLLGRPEHIEMVSQKNYAFCKEVMAASAAVAPWREWFGTLTATLTAGECHHPFDYQLIQYLDINHSWQENIHFCMGERAIITASTSDKYRISKQGPWINADGDQDLPATRKELPCTESGCFEGQLVGRFVTESGIVTIFPLGTEAQFEAPEHGTFSFTVNDDTYYDNEWHKTGAVTEHTAVTFTPAE